MSARLLILLTVTLLVPSLSHAQLNCMIPTRERIPAGQGAVVSPQLAPFRRLVLSVEEIVKRNAAFKAGVRPIRIRTTIDYSDARPRSAIVNTVAYNQEAWIASRCDVIPQADRGGGVTDGAVHVVINDPRSWFGPALVDDRVLEAFQEPMLTGHVAGYPEYNGMYVLLSTGNKAPWTIVTIAEMLDREERQVRKGQAEWAKDKERPWMTAAKISESYELMKKINASAAEETRTMMTNAMKDEQTRRPRLEAEGDAGFQKQLDDLRAYRATFSPERLRDQARMGSLVGGLLRVDDLKGQKLVKADPAFGALDPNRIHVMRVFAEGVATDAVPGRWPWMQRTKAGVDLVALSALLR